MVTDSLEELSVYPSLSFSPPTLGGTLLDLVYAILTDHTIYFLFSLLLEQWHPIELCAMMEMVHTCTVQYASHSNEHLKCS